MSKTTRLVVVLSTVAVVLAVAILGFLSYQQRRPRPTVEATGLPPVLGADPRTLSVAATARSGRLRRVEVVVAQGEKTQAFVDASAPGQESVTYQVPLDAKALGLDEGDVEVVVTATDDTWRPKPDESAQLRQRLRVDLTPPTVQFVSATRYVKHAGSAVAVWRVEDAQASGVRVGEARFPGRAGLSTDPAVRVALFAFPHAEPPGEPVLWAADEAGNERSVPFVVTFLPAKFGDDEVKLTEAFLRRKVPELAPRAAGTETVEGLLEAFLTVNRDGRKECEERIRAATSGRGSDAPLFRGAFRQQPATTVFAGFPERRTYSMNGRKVDEQWHLGLDLASNARSVVEASNAGRVVHAGMNGIYGNMVVLDHGLGLHSLYAHLSQITVKVGDEVQQGGALGRTGDTGLAGGDHLHFAMLVDGVYTNPVEWWDAAWVRDRIGRPLVEAGISVPGVTDGVSLADEPEPRRGGAKQRPRAKKRGDDRRRRRG